MVRGLLGEAVEDVHELREPARPLGLALRNAIGDAALDVELEYRKADSIQRRFRGRQLLQELDAEPRLLNHAPDASNLPFHAVQPRHDRLLLRLVEHRPVYSASAAVTQLICGQSPSWW